MDTKGRSKVASGSNLLLGVLALAQGVAIVITGTPSPDAPDRANEGTGRNSLADTRPRPLPQDAAAEQDGSEAIEPAKIATTTLGELGFDQGGLLPKISDAMADPEFFNGFVFKTAERFDRYYWSFYERAGLSEEQVEAVRDAIGLRFVEMAEGMAVGMGDHDTPMVSAFGVLDDLAVDSEERLEERLGDELYERFVDYETQLPYRNAFAKVEDALMSQGMSPEPAQADAFAVAMLEKLLAESFNKQMAFSFLSVDPSHEARIDADFTQALSSVLTVEQMQAWREWSKGEGRLAGEARRQPWVDVAREIRRATR